MLVSRIYTPLEREVMQELQFTNHRNLELGVDWTYPDRLKDRYGLFLNKRDGSTLVRELGYWRSSKYHILMETDKDGNPVDGDNGVLHEYTIVERENYESAGTVRHPYPFKK